MILVNMNKGLLKKHIVFIINLLILCFFLMSITIRKSKKVFDAMFFLISLIVEIFIPSEFGRKQALIATLMSLV